MCHGKYMSFRICHSIYVSFQICDPEKCVILSMCHSEYVSFKICHSEYMFVIPNLSLQIRFIPNFVIPNIYLRNLCSVTKDSPQESQQKRLSFLFRGGAWSSLSHMFEYPKCLSKGIIHILRKALERLLG